MKRCIAMYSADISWTAAMEGCKEKGLQDGLVGRLLTHLDTETWAWLFPYFDQRVDGVSDSQFYYANGTKLNSWIGGRFRFPSIPPSLPP